MPRKVEDLGNGWYQVGGEKGEKYHGQDAAMEAAGYEDPEKFMSALAPREPESGAKEETKVAKATKAKKSTEGADKAVEAVNEIVEKAAEEATIIPDDVVEEQEPNYDAKPAFDANDPSTAAQHRREMHNEQQVMKQTKKELDKKLQRREYPHVDKEVVG